MTKLSIIIPVYYSEKTIALLVEKLHHILIKSIKNFEIILINDGSLDGSNKECLKLNNAYNKTVVYICLSKNFSEHNAVMAGLNFCQGDYAVIIDDDFQNPPQEILKLYRKIITSDSDVVYSYYKEKKHDWFRNLGSKLNDSMANILLNKPKNLYLSSFKIIKRNLIDEIIKYKGPYPYIDGLILRSTQHIETELVQHAERQVGKSHYTFSKLVSLWSYMFINFSLKPLRWSLYLGFLFSFLGFITALAFIIEKFKNPNLPLGWASTTASLLILSGVQLLILGMIGEFIGRIYLTNNHTPQYVVRFIHKNKGNERTTF